MTIPCARADARFELPEGAYWRDIEDRDVSWLDTMKPKWRTEAVGILCVRYRLLDKREGSPMYGQERECVLDNTGGIVLIDELDYMRGGTRCTPEKIIDGFRFYLTDGNLGCGCNRAICFAEAGGEDRPEDRPCDADIRCTWPAWVADEER